MYICYKLLRILYSYVHSYVFEFNDALFCITLKVSIISETDELVKCSQTFW